MIAIIDYGVGNLFSAEKAFAALGADVRVTSDESTIRQADKIVLPGVGAFGDCMKNLKESGLIHGMVRKIQALGLKVPHMGWNSIKVREPREKTDLFRGLSDKPYVYFVHSYHAVPEDKSVITATTEYGEPLTAAVACGNIQATQFHPEKSGDVGLAILKNFVEG